MAVAAQLLHAGADLAATTSSDSTALMVAAEKGQTAAARLLLDAHQAVFRVDGVAVKFDPQMRLIHIYRIFNTWQIASKVNQAPYCSRIVMARYSPVQKYRADFTA